MRSRNKSNGTTGAQTRGTTEASSTVHEHHDDHDHDHANGHSHSHGVAGGLFHSHAGHSHGDQSAEALVKFMKGEGLDKGTKVTVLGLFTNVGLTAMKGAAGWYFHSSSLLAEAGHSLSDLLADFVTLACWRTSRQPPTDNFPYGFGKYESFGTAAVSLTLIGAALAIGQHSYITVLHVLESNIQSLPPGIAQDVFSTIVSSNITALDALAGILPHGHSHVHAPHVHEGVVLVDPNAAWFAAISVVIKEWVYRLTKKVADEENSPVLDANAQHHRSDAYSSAVALAAILGSWAIPGLPLDAVGGTIISILIFRQGWGLLRQAFKDLTDAGVSESTRTSLFNIVKPLVSPAASPSSLPTAESILGIRNIRAVRSGSKMFVDLTADVPPTMTMHDAHSVEKRIRDRIMSAKKEVREVRIHLHAVEEGEETYDPNVFGERVRRQPPC
ncbi:hypothetical protein FRB95_007166 [Tulasnella sp. JGI-2019a]|nr:hypothetical protein FRB93_013609 [Tulasnella sp. JGI-2019a]KAG9039739.1 hypothetical protein FRB95_007166 [Tulasnella sp. JGI-2019a]